MMSCKQSRFTQRMALSLALVPAALCCAGSASAFFDAELQVGKRWYQESITGGTMNFSAQEVDIAAHIDPIPLVPVAFGARVSVVNFNTDDYKGQDYYSISQAGLTEAGLDVMAWIPMVPVITPYARFDLPVYGKGAIKGKRGNSTINVDYGETANVSGYHLGIGLKYSPVPIVKILVEAQQSAETWKQDTVTVGGVSGGSTSSNTLKSNAFLVGVEIGI